MFLGLVIGSVVSTIKDPGLHGEKLLLVQPLDGTRSPVGTPLVAVDTAGVGVGEDVFFVRGREAAFLKLPGHVPADVGIVGKVDHLDRASEREVLPDDAR